MSEVGGLAYRFSGVQSSCQNPPPQKKKKNLNLSVLLVEYTKSLSALWRNSYCLHCAPRIWRTICLKIKWYTIKKKTSGNKWSHLNSHPKLSKIAVLTLTTLVYRGYYTCVHQERKWPVDLSTAFPWQAAMLGQTAVPSAEIPQGSQTTLNC